MGRIFSTEFEINDEQTGSRFLNGESTQANQPPAATWFSNKEADLYRSLAPGYWIDIF